MPGVTSHWQCLPPSPGMMSPKTSMLQTTFWIFTFWKRSPWKHQHMHFCNTINSDWSHALRYQVFGLRFSHLSNPPKRKCEYCFLRKVIRLDPAHNNPSGQTRIKTSFSVLWQFDDFPLVVVAPLDCSTTKALLPLASAKDPCGVYL